MNREFKKNLQIVFEHYDISYRADKNSKNIYISLTFHFNKELKWNYTTKALDKEFIIRLKHGFDILGQSLNKTILTQSVHLSSLLGCLSAFGVRAAYPILGLLQKCCRSGIEGFHRLLSHTLHQVKIALRLHPLASIGLRTISLASAKTRCAPWLTYLHPSLRTDLLRALEAVWRSRQTNTTEKAA